MIRKYIFICFLLNFSLLSWAYGDFRAKKQNNKEILPHNSLVDSKLYKKASSKNYTASDLDSGFSDENMLTLSNKLQKANLVKQFDRCANNNVFNVGSGIFDITGPAAEEGMMGYAMVGQKTAGILQRLWARVFIIESECNHKRIVFVNTDLAILPQGIKQQVITKLQDKYGKLYNNSNILLTAIHSHSGPGGYSTYALYNITTLGFKRKNFDVIVDGIVNAVAIAHKNIKPAEIKFAAGDLPGITYNRSPDSYLLNPKSERIQYSSNVDTKMSLIRFDSINFSDKKKSPIGVLNWFPVHGVSMNNKNHLINGDNKGYAAYLFEQNMKKNGINKFIAGFVQANAGDVSPNRYGHEGGVGSLGIEKIEHDGKAQFLKAKQLFEDAHEIIKGGVDYRHSFVAFDDVLVSPQFTNGKYQKTCTAAIGVSMLAGTQDGAGYGKQGLTCKNASKFIPGFVCSRKKDPCQGVKPIALTTGTKNPPWTANIIPLQILKIGQLVIIAAPMEMTTTAGRRLRKTVQKIMPETLHSHVVLTTLANTYVGYVATKEEYQLQRYEGASTHFGPWELAALQQEFAKLAVALVYNKKIDSGPKPLNLIEKQIDLQTDVVFDDIPLGKHFGDVKKDVNKSYRRGDTVEVIFWGAHPKNNYHIGSSFLHVEKNIKGKWKTLLLDNDWETQYSWQRKGAANSLVTINWRISKLTKPGKYRIAYIGDWKSGWSKKIYPFVGYSSEFIVY